jgi:hypothetical protein
VKIARRGFLKLLGVAPVAVPAALSRIQQSLVSGYANGTGVGAAATAKVEIAVADAQQLAPRTVSSSPITITSAERFIPEIWSQHALEVANFETAIVHAMKYGDRLDIPRIANLTAGH